MNRRKTLSTEPYPIAIIGGGFSGTLCLVQLARQSRNKLRLLLISRDHIARGLAYSTQDPVHLLNVAAGKMSAFSDAPDDFLAWLHRHPKTQHFTAGDYVPRLYYGQYLADLLSATIRDSQQDIRIIEGEATRIDSLAEGGFALSTSGGKFHVAQVILALGHEPCAIPAGATDRYITPQQLAGHPLPDDPCTVIEIRGAGLTAVDCYLTLRARGWRGRIRMVSRKGRLPQPHLTSPSTYLWPGIVPTRLSVLLQSMRQKIRSDTAWQEVVDSLRPHLTHVWTAQTIKTRQHFMKKNFGLWNIHRHRMASPIWAQIQADQEFEILSLNRPQPTPRTPAALTIHAIGQTYKTADIQNPLLQQLLHDGMVTPHATGYGIATENYRCVGKSDGLYTIGPLLIGELLETTAVPELRVQAEKLAVMLLNRTSRA
jgi:uncharacterized NAD(P)/FAD-binding protein YdhS